VRKSRGGDEDESTRWELDDELQVPEDKMPAFRWVEVAEGLDRAPSEGAVEDVSMPEGPDVRSEIECRARKDGADEGAMQVRVLGAKLPVVFVVVLVESRRP
jgi:hypothetical protein